MVYRYSNRCVPDSVFPVAGPTRYLEVKAPETGPALTPRISLVSVGYSYHALKAYTAEYARVILPHSHLGESWTSTAIDRGLLMKLDRNTSSIINGLVDSVLNAGTGGAYGAQLYAGGTGTGSRYGVWTQASCPSGSGSAATGIYESGMSDGTGSAYGGNFYAAGSGTGAKYGVVGNANAGSNVTASSMGVSGTCTHNGTGTAYGGGFSASGDGTGSKVGVSGVATAPAASSNNATGVIGIGWHYGSHEAVGGSFSTIVSGSGKGYGVKANGNGANNMVCGVYASGSSSGSGPAFGVYGRSDNGQGGYFRNATNGYYALTAWNNTGTGASVRGLYVQGHGYATGSWQTFLADGGTGFSLVSKDMEIVASGTGSLLNGAADITFEPEFSRAVSEAVVLKVIVTPTSDCNGVFVSKKSSTGFSIQELMGSKSNATFDWIALGRLRGGEQRIKTNPLKTDSNR